MNSLFVKIFVAVVLIILSINVAFAVDYKVDQKNKQFSMDELVIKVGQVVEFFNSDRFFHNVYSLSDVKSFDLGSYPKGQSKRVTFDKAGVVEVRCAIHPNMKMTIRVEE